MSIPGEISPVDKGTTKVWPQKNQAVGHLVLDALVSNFAGSNVATWLRLHHDDDDGTTTTTSRLRLAF